MPIVYSTEKKGWFLKDPSKEEMEMIQELGTAEFMRRFSAMVIESAIKAQQEAEIMDEDVEHITETVQ